MKFKITVPDGPQHVLEADYFEVTKEGTLAITTRPNDQSIAVFAAGFWSSIISEAVAA